jgi:AAA family ATP:ADP antiporter
MTRVVERLLGLHPGEGRRGLLLFSYLFLVISSLVASKATRDALFLEHFQAVQLPYVDIAIAILVGGVVSVYLRLGRRLDLPSLQAGSLMVLSAVSLVFWWLAREGQHSDVLVVVIYIWVGILGVLAPAQVWMLANFVVTTRGAKRVFGLIGSGAIAGWIGGGLLTQTIVPLVGADNMLLGVAGALTACAALVLVIWRERPAAIAGHTVEMASGRGLRDGIALVWQSPHLRAIAMLILISSFVTTIAGWQFKAIAKAHVPQTDALAAFFGAFNLYAGVASLAVQLLLTAPLLRTFGIGFGLLLVPALMAAGTGGVLITGGLAAAVFLKGSDQVLRYSIDKATIELLYLPVPRAETFRAKSVIDTVVWRCGDGLAGLLVLLLAGWLRLSPPQLGWVNLALIALWMAAAMAAGRRYVRALTESIHQHRLDIERASTGVLDRTGAGIMAEGLASRDTAEVLYALDLFESERRRRSHPAVVGLLAHRDPEVRRRALRVLIEAGDTSAISAVEPLLHDDRIDVRTEALLYLAQCTGIDPLHRIEEVGAVVDYSIQAGVIAFLARPGASQNLDAAGQLLDVMSRSEGEAGRRSRLEAARLLRWLPHAFEDQLHRLLRDPDPEVAREAVVAAGALGARPFVRDIIDRLADPLIVPDAVDALVLCGDSSVVTLRECLRDRSLSRAIRREIPAALLGIATPAAHSALVEHLSEPDAKIRFRIITALNKLSQAHPDWRVDTGVVETVVKYEIVGLYRSYQVMGAIRRFSQVPDRALVALDAAMANETERIFRLLKVLFPKTDLHSVYVGLQSGNIIVHDNALELIEATLTPRLRDLLVPLVDGAVSVATRVQAADRVVGLPIASASDLLRVVELIEDPLLYEEVQEALKGSLP